MGLPQFTLPSIPPIVLTLSETAGALGPASSCLNANANMSAKLSLLAGLPPLPIPALQLAALAALPPMTALIQSKMGFNPLLPMSAAVTAKLNMTFSLLNGLVLPPISIGPLLQLGTTLSTIATLKAALGINLLAPNASIALQAALNATANLALPLSLAALTNASHYAMLASLAASMGISLAGGLGPLAASLSLAAAVSLPALTFNPTELLAVISALALIRGLLRIDPFAADFSAKLNLGLAPLGALAVTIPVTLGAAAASGMLLGLLLPCLSMNLQAMAGINCSALIGIPLPNLGPLTLAASLMAGAKTGSCAPGCLIS
ncbi:MAG: hypothetical protein JWQ71_4048 [Pedosphaera sp.]|nr:hypothetical protein [Pedosphaera sp.]